MASESTQPVTSGAWPGEVEVVGSTVIPPDPQILEAIGLNYALEAAIADLVDNSIDAGAANVLIRFVRRGARLISLCVIDNGRGMDETELELAMSLGRRRTYEPSDLGHFGLGLKAASLGQAKSLTVISKSRKSSANGRRWLTESAKDGFACDVVGRPFAAELLVRPWGSFQIRTGTLVLWDNVTAFPRSQDGKTTSVFIENTIPQLRNHLGLVFHRLLDDGRVMIEIDVEDVDRSETGAPQQVLPIDPFGYGKSGREDYPKHLRVEVDSQSLYLECHMWPPQSRSRGFKVPGSSGHKGQGFYFYRNDRLLQAGGWNGVYQSHSYYQLARVSIEIDHSLHKHMTMNPEKTQIRVSDAFVRAIETGDNQGFSINEYREDAAQRQRESRRQAGTRQKVIPPGRGFAPTVRQAIEAELDFIAGEDPIDIRWYDLRNDALFEIDKGQRAIALNRKYRWALIGDREATLNDAPLLKALLYLLVKDLFEGEYLGAKEKDNITLWQAILTEAAKKEVR